MDELTNSQPAGIPPIQIPVDPVTQPPVPTVPVDPVTQPPVPTVPVDNQPAPVVPTVISSIATPAETTGGAIGTLTHNFEVAQAALPKAEKSLQDVYEASARSNSAIVQMMSYNHDYPVDLEYAPTKEYLLKKTNGLPLEIKDRVMHSMMLANSQDHADSIIEDAYKQLEDQDATAGVSGFVFNTAHLLTDPSTVAAMFATRGGSALMKGGVLERVVLGGAINGYQAGKLEEYLHSEQVAREDNTVMTYGLGIALGGLGGAFTSTEKAVIRKAGQDLADISTIKQVETHGKEFGLTVNPEATAKLGMTHVDPAVVPDNSNIIEHVDESDWEMGKIDYSLTGKPEGFGEGTGGAAAVAGAHQDVESSAKMLAFRFDLFALLEKQNNPIIRQLNRLLHPDAVGGDGVAGVNAMEDAQFTKEKFTGEYLKKTAAAYREYSLDNPVGLLGRHKRYDKFMNELSDAKENPDAAVHPSLKRLAGEVHEIEKRILADAQKYGVEGAEDVEAALHYVTRKFSKDKRLLKTAELEEELGSTVKAHEAWIETIAKSIMSGHAKEGLALAPKKAATIARAYYKTVMELPYNTQGARLLAGTMGAKEYGMLREVLTNELKIDQGDIEAVMEIITGKPKAIDGPTTGTIARFKKRTLLDESYSQDFHGVTVSIKDLFERNHGKLFTSYVSQLSGATALARVGIKSSADFSRQLTAASEYAAKHSFDDVQTARHVRWVDDSYKTIMGISLETNPHSIANRSIGVLRDWQFTRLMGQAGWAQGSDLGNVIGRVGPLHLLRYLPMRELLKVLKGGQFESGIYRDVQMMHHIGVEMLNHMEITPLSEVAFNKGLTGLENVANVGKHVTNRISMMASVNNFVHQLSQGAVFTKIIDDIVDSKPMTNMQLKRMATAGLSQDNLNNLKQLLPQYTTRDAKGKLVGINYTDFAAQHADLYETLERATHREARRAAQRQVRGETHPWMHTQVGQVLMQFRGFMIAAFPKQTLHGLNHFDRTTAMQWLWSSMMASFAYTAQTSINFAGNQEELDKRLSTDKIVAAGVARSSWSSLSPMAIDTAMGLTGNDEIFSHSRTTGQSQNLITGSPAYGFVTGAMDTASNLSKSAASDDSQFTQSDVKKGMSLVLPRYHLMTNFINATAEDFPKSHTQNSYE